jgi:hypothetical protein
MKGKVNTGGRPRMISPAIGLLTIFVLAGCCQVVPFWDCQRELTVFVHVTATSHSNNGFPVESRFLMVSDVSGFDQLSTAKTFNPTSTNNLNGAALRDTSMFVQPNSETSFHWTIRLPDGAPELQLYLCAIANFSSPKSLQSSKAVIELDHQSGLDRAVIRFDESRIEISRHY